VNVRDVMSVMEVCVEKKGWRINVEGRVWVDSTWDEEIDMTLSSCLLLLLCKACVGWGGV
jgi:hypothetical protein